MSRPTITPDARILLYQAIEEAESGDAHALVAARMLADAGFHGVATKIRRIYKENSEHSTQPGEPSP